MTRRTKRSKRSGGRGWLPCPILGLSLLTAGCYGGRAGSGEAAEESGGVTGDESGESGDSGGEPLDACAGAIPELAPRALHRLSPLQYRNTIRDLFDDPEFVPSYSDLETIPTELGVRQLRADAESVLARRDQWGVDVFGCDVTGPADAACAESFIDSFGPRALRHPLTSEERAEYVALYESAIATSPLAFTDAMEVVLASMLQAPQFLYLVEVGEPIEGGPAELRRLTGHELASRLSYLLWDTLPDADLLAAAEAGELSTRAGLEAQAERMLADPRAESMVQDFMSEWMQLDGGRLHFALEESNKDGDLFPAYGPALQESMRTEYEAFIREVYFGDGDATFERLLTDNRAYVDASMAAVYGVPAPADGTWGWVELDPSQRSGVLSRAAFLTVFGTAVVQSPIRRGVYVIEEVLCSDLGIPPPNVDNSPINGGNVDDGSGNVGVMTVRQEVEARTAEDQCQTCHGIINSAGFAFEHYDAIGRWQDEELATGLPIDSSGSLKAGDMPGPVADALELADKLAASEQVKSCFAGRWLYRATGSAIHEVSDCDRDATVAAFSESGNIRELLVSVIVSDSFRFLNTGDE